MPEIRYKELDRCLKDAKKTGFPGMILIHGEEALCKTALNAVLDALLPGTAREMNYEPVENDNVFDALERVNTYSMLGGPKVVSLCDSRVFYAKQDDSKFIEKAKQAHEKDNLKSAAKYLSNLVGRMGMSFEEFGKADRAGILKADSELIGDGAWIDDILQFCLDGSISVSVPADHSESLRKAVDKGFAEGNHLIVTSDMTDKRRTLFKAIKKNGLAVDCSVPKGDRKADRMEQETVLKERMKTILSERKKTMRPDVFHALLEMTGFDVRTFCNNLEKLATYVGERKEITIRDAESLLKRTKKDPIYEFTNAIADRNIEKSLFFLDSLLSADFFPLQLMAALTNQIRRLLMAKDFTESPHGRSWHPGMQYSQFQNMVLPEVIKYDEALSRQAQEWEGAPPEEPAGKKKGKKNDTDLKIVKNPRSPYPVYLLLKNAGRFSKAELIDAVGQIGEADLRLKSTGQNPKLVLEKVVFSICAPAK